MHAGSSRAVQAGAEGVRLKVANAPRLPQGRATTTTRRPVGGSPIVNTTPPPRTNGVALHAVDATDL